MQCKFKIFRFDPAKDSQPRYQEFVIEADPSDKILDCLNRIRWELDGTLAYRMSCAHGVCGSDGMAINGVAALACQRLVKDYPKPEFLIEPLPFFKVVKDLVVDLDPFFRKYEEIEPYLISDSPAPETERLQSPENRKEIDEAVKCILCACCTASCPINHQNPKYVGPAALLRAYRYLYDERDTARAKRVALLDNPNGAWGCQILFKCTEVCPKSIPVTQCISLVKKRIFESKKKG